MQLQAIYKQSAEHKNREWFTCPDADLYIWRDSDGIRQFEFCYNKGRHEQSIRWERGRGCVKMCVDDGESTAHNKRSAILKACGGANWQQAAREFRLCSRDLPLELRHFVLTQFTNQLMTPSPAQSKMSK